MSLAKNLGERVGVKENFLKILLQICENPKRSQKFSEKFHFLAKKVKILFKNTIFLRNPFPYPPKLMYGMVRLG